MKMRIVADSSANLLEMKDVELASVPVHIIVGEQDYADTARSILRPTIRRRISTSRWLRWIISRRAAVWVT